MKQWLCERERTVKAATWVAAQRQTRAPNLLGEVGTSELEPKALTRVEESIADHDFIRRLEDLGMSPRFRYKKGSERSYESWITPDGITEASVLLEDGTSKFLDEMTKNKDLFNQKSRAILEEQLKRDTSLSFETWFEDGTILTSSKGISAIKLDNVVTTKTGQTDAETFTFHRQAVEERSKLNNVLRVEDTDDILAQNYYFLRYRRGVVDTLALTVLKKFNKFFNTF